MGISHLSFLSPLIMEQPRLLQLICFFTLVGLIQMAAISVDDVLESGIENPNQEVNELTNYPGSNFGEEIPEGRSVEVRAKCPCLAEYPPEYLDTPQYYFNKIELGCGQWGKPWCIALIDDNRWWKGWKPVNCSYDNCPRAF